MSNIIKVRLTKEDKFVVTDPDTGSEKVFRSGVLHTPDFIVPSIVKDFFCGKFPGKTSCLCSEDALDRIRSICDFNCISDEIRY